VVRESTALAVIVLALWVLIAIALGAWHTQRADA
jgi:hypothetical protein